MAISKTGAAATVATVATVAVGVLAPELAVPAAAAKLLGRAASKVLPKALGAMGSAAPKASNLVASPFRAKLPNSVSAAAMRRPEMPMPQTARMTDRIANRVLEQGKSHLQAEAKHFVDKQAKKLEAALNGTDGEDVGSGRWLAAQAVALAAPHVGDAIISGIQEFATDSLAKRLNGKSTPSA